MSGDERDPMATCLHRWHSWLRRDLEGGLEALLHEDCVFYSPIVFTPQRGRDITALYLSAAAESLVGDPSPSASSTPGGGAFGYVKEVSGSHLAVLEFETTVGDRYVNGIDMITCDDDSMITEFKVMIRPLQAVNMVHEQMAAMLEQMQK